jgi:hypothetical protein
MSNSPFNQRVVATGIQGVPKSTGAGMETCNVAIKRPMPCIVILVHGVNDVGEAYQNQEQGIIAGLNERMGRTDMYPHEWHQFKMDMGDGEQQNVKMPGRSPVILFIGDISLLIMRHIARIKSAIVMSWLNSGTLPGCPTTPIRKMTTRSWKNWGILQQPR